MAAKARKAETQHLAARSHSSSAARPHGPTSEPSFMKLTASLPPFTALSYAEFAAIGRDNIEAAVKANAAVSAGAEAIGREMMACARAVMQRASETARGLLGARTFEDVVKLQSDLAARSLEGMMAGSARLSELGYSLASEAMAPWEGRYEAVMAKLTPAGEEQPADKAA